MRAGLIVPGFSASEADWCIPALLNLIRELARRSEVHVFTLRSPHRRRRYAVYGATVGAFGGARTSCRRHLVDGGLQRGPGFCYCAPRRGSTEAVMKHRELASMTTTRADRGEACSSSCAHEHHPDAMITTGVRN